MSRRSPSQGDTEGWPQCCRPALERALLDPPAGPLEREAALTEAAECLREELQRDGSQAALWLFLGEIELLRGEPAHAERAYRSAVRIAPDDVGGLAGLAEACEAQGRANEAERWLERAIQLEPTGELYAQLGHLLLEDGRLEEAEGALRTALALEPDDDQVLFLVARFFARDDEEAERLLRRAVELAPDSVLAHAELGALCHSRDDHAGARVCFERVIALDPEGSEGYRDLAAVELEGDPPRAEELARTALEHNRDDVGAWTVLGQALQLQDRAEEAERALLTACAIEPLELDGARAHWVLSDLYAEQDRLADAVAALLQVASFAPSLPAIAADLGELYARLGRRDEARSWLQVALEHDLDDGESRELLQRLEAEG
jgi:tetratricopeptide (TPR) repeat protein